MKKEHMIFLVFLLSAAVVAGATAGFISNFKYIAQYYQTAQAQTCMVAQEPEEDSVAGTTNRAEKVLVVSEQEEEAILDMLLDLGMDQAEDPSRFIAEFQQEQSLEPTGNLDSVTLQAIIQQATLKKAANYNQ